MTINNVVSVPRIKTTGSLVVKVAGNHFFGEIGYLMLLTAAQYYFTKIQLKLK